MGSSDIYIYAAIGVGAFILINGLSGGKVANATGQAIGNTAGGIVGGAPLGLVTGYLDTLKSAQQYAQKDEPIPVIDWYAKPIGMLIGSATSFINATDKSAALQRIFSYNWNPFSYEV